MSKSIEDYVRDRGIPRAGIEKEKEALKARIDAYELAEARKEAGLTQVQMAENMGVSQKRISEIEHGRAKSIRLGTLERYATALGGTLSVEIEYHKADGAKRKLKFPVGA